MANEPKAHSWPWSEEAPPAYSKVPQLGLSAAFLHESSDERGRPQPDSPAQSSVILDGRDPHLNVDVAIGDQITVTKADGTRQAYRVTGWELFEDQDTAADGADPHFPRPEVPLGGSLRLMIEAVHANMLENQERKL